MVVGTATGLVGEYALDSCALLRRFGDTSGTPKKVDVKFDPKLMIGKVHVVNDFCFAWTGNGMPFFILFSHNLLGTMHIFSLGLQDPEPIHSFSFGKRTDAITYANGRICALAGGRFHIIEPDLDKLRKGVEALVRSCCLALAHFFVIRVEIIPFRLRMCFSGFRVTWAV